MAIILGPTVCCPAVAPAAGGGLQSPDSRRRRADLHNKHGLNTFPFQCLPFRNVRPAFWTRSTPRAGRAPTRPRPSAGMTTPGACRGVAGACGGLPATVGLPLRGGRDDCGPLPPPAFQRGERGAECGGAAGARRSFNRAGTQAGTVGDPGGDPGGRGPIGANGRSWPRWPPSNYNGMARRRRARAGACALVAAAAVPCSSSALRSALRDTLGQALGSLPTRLRDTPKQTSQWQLSHRAGHVDKLQGIVWFKLKQNAPK